MRLSFASANMRPLTVQPIFGSRHNPAQQAEQVKGELVEALASRGIRKETDPAMSVLVTSFDSKGQKPEIVVFVDPQKYHAACRVLADLTRTQFDHGVNHFIYKGVKTTVEPNRPLEASDGDNADFFPH